MLVGNERGEYGQKLARGLCPTDTNDIILPNSSNISTLIKQKIHISCSSPQPTQSHKSPCLLAGRGERTEQINFADVRLGSDILSGNGIAFVVFLLMFSSVTA